MLIDKHVYKVSSIDIMQYLRHKIYQEVFIILYENRGDFI